MASFHIPLECCRRSTQTVSMLWSCDRDRLDSQQPTSSDTGLNNTYGQLWADTYAQYQHDWVSVALSSGKFSTELLELLLSSLHPFPGITAQINHLHGVLVLASALGRSNIKNVRLCLLVRSHWGPKMWLSCRILAWHTANTGYGGPSQAISPAPTVTFVNGHNLVRL